MIRNQNRKFFHFICLAFVLSFSFLFWKGSLDDFFAQDDFIFFEGLKHLTGDRSELIEALAKVGPVDNTYRPISTVLYFTVMQEIADLNAFAYHAFNVAIHAFSAVILYITALMLFGSITAALWCAIFFASRSLAYVPVYWVSGIQELTAGFFSFLFAVCIVLLVKKKNYKHALTSLLLYILAAGSKEGAFCIIATLIPLWLLVRPPAKGHDLQRMIIITAAFFITGISLWTMRTQITAGYETVYEIGNFNPLKIMHLICWTLYGIKISDPHTLWFAGSCFIIALLVPGLIRLTSRKTPSSYASGGLLLFSAALLASIPMLLLKGRTIHYYLYIPSFFISLSAVSFFTAFTDRSKKTKTAVWTIAYCLLAVSAFLEYRIIQAKDQTSWKQVMVMTQDGRKIKQYVKNEKYINAKWLNADFRLRTRNIYNDLTEIVPAKFPPQTTLFMVGWIEYYVGSNIRSGGKNSTPFLPRNPCCGCSSVRRT